MYRGLGGPHLERTGVDWRMILKWTLMEQNGVDWIYVVQDTGKLFAFLKTVMYFRVP